MKSPQKILIPSFRRRPESSGFNNNAELSVQMHCTYGSADLFVISAKAEIQCLNLTGFPPPRERRNRINQRLPIYLLDTGPRRCDE